MVEGAREEGERCLYSDCYLWNKKLFSRNLYMKNNDTEQKFFFFFFFHTLVYLQVIAIIHSLGNNIPEGFQGGF